MRTLAEQQPASFVFFDMKPMSDVEKCSHLLRRFGLGASESEVDYFLDGGTIDAAIEKLINYEAVEDPVFTIDRMANDKGQINMKACQVWWYAKLLMTKRPLEQALTLFWHNHFATSAEKVDAVGAMHDHVETLRSNCSGRFMDLLMAVSKDPAMLYWLDNHENKKGKPNENFAREIMELFTLGIGHYSEKDVQEAARALTGWTYGVRRGNRIVETSKPAQRPKLKEGAEPQIRFLFRQEQHDSEEKLILGNRGNFDGDDLIGILSGNPRTAIFLTQKFVDWFVYPNADAKYIERLAKTFRDSGLNIKELCRAVIKSPEFWSERCMRAVVKNPVQFAAGTLRQLGLGQRVEALFADTSQKNARGGAVPLLLSITCKSMGMDLLFPPDVSGWKSGDAWISSATMVERMKWSDILFGRFVAGKASKAAPASRTLNYPVFSLVKETPSPRGLVDRLVVLFDAPLSGSKKDKLYQAADDATGGTLTEDNANMAAAAVARLIFGSPEFQFC